MRKKVRFSKKPVFFFPPVARRPSIWYTGSITLSNLGSVCLDVSNIRTGLFLFYVQLPRLVPGGSGFIHPPPEVCKPRRAVGALLPLLRDYNGPLPHLPRAAGRALHPPVPRLHGRRQRRRGHLASPTAPPAEGSGTPKRAALGSLPGLIYSLIWGAGAVLVLAFLNPLLYILANLFPRPVLWGIDIALSVLFLADLLILLFILRPDRKALKAGDPVAAFSETFHSHPQKSLRQFRPAAFPPHPPPAPERLPARPRRHRRGEETAVRRRGLGHKTHLGLPDLRAAGRPD